MPPVVIAVAAYAASAWAAAAVAAAGWGAFAVLAVKFAVTFAVSAIGNKLLGRGASNPGVTPQARRETIRAAAENRRVVYGEMRTGGVLIYAESYGESNKYVSLLIALAHKEVEAIYPNFWLNNDAITNTKFGGNYSVYNDAMDLLAGVGPGDPLVTAQFFRGNPGQAQFNPNPASQPLWTEEHQLNEVCYVNLDLRYDPEVFKAGLPSASFLVRGRKLYDPRTETTYWSANPALCALDYLRADFGMQCPDDLIDFDSFIAAANICDEEVTTLDGPAKRYTCNALVDLGANPATIIGGIESSCGGHMVFSGGLYKFFVGAYDLPVAEIGPSAMRADPTVRTAPARSELFNAVRGLYVEPAHDYQDTDYAGQVSAEGAWQDQGAIEQQLNLPFTTHHPTAQRLARIALNRARGGRSLKLPLNWSGLQLKLWDVVTLNVPGVPVPADVSFRVMEWSLVEEGGVDVVLQEERADFYDWDFETMEKPVEGVGSSDVIEPEWA